MRENIMLACSECKQRNYALTKNKKKHSDRMKLKKHCRFCRVHVLHVETK